MSKSGFQILVVFLNLFILAIPSFSDDGCPDVCAKQLSAMREQASYVNFPGDEAPKAIERIEQIATSSHYSQVKIAAIDLIAPALQVSVLPNREATTAKAIAALAAIAESVSDRTLESEVLRKLEECVRLPSEANALAAIRAIGEISTKSKNKQSKDQGLKILEVLEHGTSKLASEALDQAAKVIGSM